MFRRRPWAVFLLWLSITACGSAEPTDPPAPAVTVIEPAVSTPEATGPRPDETAPPLIAPGGVTAESVVVPPEASSRTGALGSMVLLAERCTLTGPPPEAPDAFDAIRAVAWDGGSAVYYLDREGLLRRLTDTGDEACLLTPDGSFGDHGAITLGEDPASRPRWLALDESHHLYASSPLAGTHRLTGEHVDYHCDTVGRVTVSPDGRHGMSLFGTGPARRIDFDERSCTSSEWVPAEAPSILESVSFLDDARVLLGGQAGREGPHTARAYDLSGAPIEPAFGSDDASAADYLCYTHAVIDCAVGTCVIDGNCRAILGRDREGAIVGRVPLAALTGMGAPWIVPPARVFSGMTFFAAAEPITSDDGSRRFIGAIFRLHGL